MLVLKVFVQLVCAAVLFGNVNDIKANEIEAIDLFSSAFKEGDKMPVPYTCDGDELSPPLVWSKVPEGTKSFVVAYRNYRNWTYWIRYNIPPQTRQIGEGTPGSKILPDGSRQGINSEKMIRYFGSCPYYPQDTYFEIYAIDTQLKPADLDNWEYISKQMNGHILGKGKITVFYFRKR